MQNQAQKPKTELKYRAFYLSIGIIKFLESLKYRQAIKIISDQLIRSVTSIGAIFEISLKSSQESKYWLAMLKELLPDGKEKIDVFARETDEIAKILSSSVLTMKGKRNLKSLI